MGSYKANNNSGNNSNNSNSTEQALQAGAQVALKATPVGRTIDGIRKVPGVGKVVDNRINKTIHNVSNILPNNQPKNNLKNNNNINNNVNDDMDNNVDVESKKDNRKKKNISSIFSNNKSKSKSSFDGDITKFIGKSFKIKLIVACSIVFVFIMMVFAVFAQDDLHNLDLMNGDSDSSANTINIENRIVYVGDSRIASIESSLSNNMTFVTGDGYDWLNSDGVNELDDILKNKTDSIVVFSSGINDLSNIDNYIDLYKNLISKYPSISFYVIGLSQIDESKVEGITNSEINDFNKKLKENFSSNYIESFTNFDLSSSSDGINYDQIGSVNFNDYVISNIKTSVGDEEIINSSGESISTCALVVSNNIYYKVKSPMTKSCKVDGWYSDNSWGLEPNFHTLLKKFIVDMNKQCFNETIISGHRSYEKQEYLYKCYTTKSCNHGNLAAKPGSSHHEYGIAADLAYSPKSTACIDLYHAKASKYGLKYAVKSENWHIEPANIKKGKP